MNDQTQMQDERSASGQSLSTAGLGDGWISLAERLPTERVDMLVATRHGWEKASVIAPVLVTDGTLIVEGIFNDIGEEYSSGIDATHWKPKSPNV